MIRISRGAVGFVVLLSLGGCSYRGALYSEYGQIGLGVRAAPEQGSPAELHFGYDRGVFAWVPKSGAEKRQGDAGSIISRNHIRTDLAEAVSGAVAPAAASNGSSGSLLAVDAAFISGTAAVVAAVPANSVVQIQSPDGSVARFVTQGGPGARIAAALSPRFPTEEIRDLHALVGELHSRGQPELYDAVAGRIGGEFDTAYQKQRSAGPRTAFNRAMQKYLVDEPGSGPRHAQVIAVLKHALKGD